MNRQRDSGFTLLEMMLAVGIAAIVATLAVPSFQEMLERNRLKEAIEGLKSDLQWMRTETIKKSCNLQATFTKDAPGTTWSYEIDIPPAAAGSPCAVQQFYHGCLALITDAAAANCPIKSMNSAQFSGISMSNVTFISAPTTDVEFDFKRGEAQTAPPANQPKNGRVELRSAHYTVKVVVAPVGRVKICNIAGSTGLSGYQNC